MAWRGARRTYEQMAAPAPARPVADHYSIRYGHGIGAFAIGGDPIGGIVPGFAKEFRSLPPLDQQQPLPAHMDRSVGLFVINGAPIPAAAIGVGQQTGYVPAWAPDGRIGVTASYCSPGGLTIGRSAVGNMGRPFHGPQHVEMRSLTPGGPAYPVIVDDPS